MSENVNEISEVQARAMAQVCLDLHAAIGVKWGDDPYAAIASERQRVSDLEAALIVFQEHADNAEGRYESERQQNAELRRERDALAGALEELVACQSRDYIRWLDPEERTAAREAHMQRERAAWQAARAALATRRQATGV